MTYAFLSLFFLGFFDLLISLGQKGLITSSLVGSVISLVARYSCLKQLSFLIKTWLGDLATEMKSTLSKLLKDCLKASKSGNVDPNRFPSQVCLVCKTFYKLCTELQRMILTRFVKSVKFDCNIILQMFVRNLK